MSAQISDTLGRSEGAEAEAEDSGLSSRARRGCCEISSLLACVRRVKPTDEDSFPRRQDRQDRKWVCDGASEQTEPQGL